MSAVENVIGLNAMQLTSLWCWQPAIISNMSNTEEWRAIEGHPAFEVSNLGGIRRVLPSSCHAWKSKPVPYPIKPVPRGKYLCVALEGGKRAYVHRLVAIAFVPGYAPGLEAAHNDGSKTNNRADNLRWATRSENAKDMMRHGTQPMATKKMFPPMIERVRRLRQLGNTYEQISTQTGLSQSTIYLFFRKHRATAADRA